MLAAEGLQVGRRVDVGDRREGLVRVVAEQAAQLAPAALDLGEVGHVGHRAAGGEVGQDGDLFRLGHDVRHLGHEVHAAEHDVFGVGLAGQARQLERVAGQVGVTIDVLALVMMAEDDRALAQLFTGGEYARLRLVIGQGVEAVETDGGDLHAMSLNCVQP